LSKLKLESLADYVWAALNKNYMLGILVTSQAQARVKGSGWSFGAGKSTFALSFMKTFCYGGNFDRARTHLMSFAQELDPYLNPDAPRTPAIMIDDMQLDFGKHRSHDPEMRELCYFLTTQRTCIGIIIGTTSHRGMLAKDFREEMFHFEVIIPDRGTFEIQQLRRWLPFDDPITPRERLEPRGVGPFLALPSEEEEWYLAWRKQRDLKAKARVKLLKKGGEEEGALPQLMNYHEFDIYIHRVLNSKIGRDASFQLWKVYRREADPWPALRNWL